jgi:Ras family protein A
MGARYMECSSKEMTGVHEIFDTAIDVTVRGQDVATDSASSSSNSGSGGVAVPARKKKSKMCSIL